MILNILFVISCYVFCWSVGITVMNLIKFMCTIYLNKSATVSLAPTLMACSISFAYIMWYIFTGVGIA